MKVMKAKTLVHGLAAVSLAVSLAVGAAVPALADAKRPMALMIMVDGMRADAVGTQYMPNLARLRNGEWQPGYKAAWSMDAQIAPGSVPSSAPNHTSIATGVPPSKHGVTANGNTSSGDFSTYPTWLKRVAGAGKSALFIYKSWDDDDALGPDPSVTFESGTDAENAASLAAKLASANAPDATMYFINAPDDAGHAYGFYPMSDQYRAALQTADGYIGACLAAIANRSTFADEDWLIMVTSDHGGFLLYHGEIKQDSYQAHTVPIIIAGKNVTAGRIPGLPYNMDVAASALNHFGVTVSGLDATLRDNLAVVEPTRTLSDGLAAYLPFDSSSIENAASGSSVSPTANGSVAVADNGKFGSYLDIQSGGYVNLDGSDSGSLAYENGNKSFAATIWVKMPSPASGDPVLLTNKKWSPGNAKGVIMYAGYAKLDWQLKSQGVAPRGVAMNAADGSARLDMGPFSYEDSSDWTFYALTRSDDGAITMYQGRADGTLDWVSGGFGTFSLETGYPFSIGQDASGTYSHKFVGSVDDFGLWTRSLTHDEISKIYSAGRAGVALGTLAVASAGPAAATWTGAVSSDPAVAGNWSGNEVPTFDTAVTISGTASMTIADGATLPCKSIFFDNVKLGSDFGGSGIDGSKIVAGSSIDLDGHVLRLRSAYSLPISVTDSSANAAHPGELHFDDLGYDIANVNMSLSGNLRFFKSGSGKFTASASATYTGGIAVEGGSFVMARNASGDIFVGSGATLDQYGYSLSSTRAVLSGGTITSTRALAQNVETMLPSYLNLEADSSITFANISGYCDKRVPSGAVWNLGGNTLNVVLDGADPDFKMDNNNGETISNGTFKVIVNASAGGGTAGKGWVPFAALNGRDGLSLDLGTSILRMKHPSPNRNSSVYNFTCNPLANQTIYSGNKLEIYGTFTPQSTDGFNLLMMDGSAIDLSSWSNAWNCAFANSGGYAGGSETGCKVAFADGATVTVSLAGRTDLDDIAEAGGYVVTWAANAAPSASVTFVLDATTAALPQGYRLRKDSTGLKLTKKTGMVIIMR